MADQLSKPIDDHVLIKIIHPRGYGWYVRLNDNRGVELIDDANIRRARRLTRDSAYAIRNHIRSRGLESHIVDPRRTDVYLFERSAPQEDLRPSVDRVPHHIGDVLIVPASLGRWAIRFPGTENESCYGVTPEDAYAKVAGLAPNLLQYAERYEPPTPEPVPTPSANDLPDGQRYRTTS